MVTANEIQPNNPIQVDLDLVQRSGRTAALVFAIVRHYDPLVGEGDAARFADVMKALDLGESTTRRTLAKLEQLGLVWSEQSDPQSHKEFFTKYTSFGEWVTDQEHDEQALQEATMCDLANDVYQANSDREVLA